MADYKIGMYDTEQKIVRENFVGQEKVVRENRI